MLSPPVTGRYSEVVIQCYVPPKYFSLRCRQVFRTSERALFCSVYILQVDSGEGMYKMMFRDDPFSKHTVISSDEANEA